MGACFDQTLVLSQPICDNSRCVYKMLSTYFNLLQICHRVLILGTEYLVPSTWYQIAGEITWCQGLGTKNQVPSTWDQVIGNKDSVPSTWYQVSGTKYSIPSTCCQVLGTKFALNLLKSTSVGVRWSTVGATPMTFTITFVLQRKKRSSPTAICRCGDADFPRAPIRSLSGIG